MMTTDRCLIWPDSVTQEHLGHLVDSPRAGGKYRFDPPPSIIVLTQQLQDLDDDVRARLTTLLVDLRNQGQEVPLVTSELVERARKARPLDMDERAERLLRFIGSQSTRIGDTVKWDHQLQPQALAWSESISWREVEQLFRYLSGQSWIEPSPLFQGHQVTVEGYRRLAEVKTNVDSAQGFVAMWFGDEMNDAYEKGIEPAILDAGYKPMRIDRKPDVNKIDDEIIAEIRRSRFLVADFTHGEDGARGGVYYEAGFAYGLGIPVIYTCREGSIDEVHFDTRQYHHTTWSSPEGLREDLKNRILALIGEGPVRGSAAP